MSAPERFYANLFVQLAALTLLALYVYMTIPDEPNNGYWLAASGLLFLYGLLRPTVETILVSLGFVLIYGGLATYSLWFAASPVDADWNDLIWLVSFPAVSLLGGMNKERFTSQEDSAFAFLDPLDAPGIQQDEALGIEERFGFLSGPAFLYKLEEEVIKALRDRQKFHLVLIEVERLQEFKRIFGGVQAAILLNQLAEWLQKYSLSAKAKVGESMLACIVPEEDRSVVDEMQQQLAGLFLDMRMNRPRREANVKLQLRFGVSECPEDGIEARSLMESAQSVLRWKET
ncbi:diguanylate cyclase domain-containing protein [Cohnella faecalis]|uniref:Diguanylate cyclase n=1 Tax=Cohnella faecalis TaxID=2315694 RepID=A0A398CI88_9BACL|nr:diguanylate cyclase [Cohnella faecalis]RIE00548.1 diguanylate cyclase [Cohnella faecalis]